MSISVMKWIWENSTTSGSERLVLLALADFAKDDGICWPSFHTIAQKTNLSQRYIIILIKNLETTGAIKIERRREGPINRSNRYQIIVPENSNSPIPKVVSSDSQGSESQDTTGSEPDITRVVNPDSPEPSINHNNQTPRGTISLRKRPTKEPNLGLYPIAQALAAVTRISLEANRARIFKEAKELAKDCTATPEKIIFDYGPDGLWYRADWRGQRGQAPSLTQVRSTWGTLKINVNGGQPKSEPKGFAAIRDYIRQEEEKNDRS